MEFTLLSVYTGMCEPHYICVIPPPHAHTQGGGLWMYGIWAPSLTACSFTNNSVSTLDTVSIGANAGARCC